MTAGDSTSLRPDERVRGLGLISINERVRLVGGNVSLFTEVNKGTRVKVHVPLTALSPVAR